MADAGASTVHPACCNAVEYPPATPLVVESFTTKTVTPACDAVVDVEDDGLGEVVVDAVEGTGVVGRATTGEPPPAWRISTPSTTATTITAIARENTM